MARFVEMPKLSPTMEEGQIATWHVAEGDTIDNDDLLAEVETDKATMEFKSFDRGVVLKILAGPGAVVKLGDPVAIVGDKGEDISQLLAQVGSGAGSAAAATSAPSDKTSSEKASSEKAPAEKAPAEKAKPGAEQAAEPRAREATAAPEAPAEATGGDGRVRASPYVRKLARERGVDLHAVSGSGPGGRIVAQDLERAPAPAKAAPGSGWGSGRAAAAAPPAEAESRPLSMMRKTIARRLTESKQTVPHFYLTIDVDAGPLDRLRKQLNEDLAAGTPRTGGEPTKLSFNDLVIKAAAIAITRAPAVNAQFTPDAILYHKRVDISVAVAVEDGLVTPVLRNADRKTVLEISAEVRILAARARDKKLKPDEMSGGTFSISNLGMYGIDEFAAVINPPEGAILAVGGVRSEPVVVGDAVVPGKRMKLTLSCDHRVVDGAIGATFLAELRKVLVSPMQILAW